MDLFKYRLVKHVWQLTVQESIGVEVFLQQSSNSEVAEQLALDVKVTNLNNVHHAVLTNISLLRAALLSQYWVLGEEFFAPANLKLKSQEIGHVVFKAKRKLPHQNSYSEAYLSEKKILPDVNNGAYLDFAKKYEAHGTDGGQIEAVFVLQWQASVAEENCKKIINGQYHIPVRKLNKVKSDELTDFDEPINLFDKPSCSNVDKSESNELAPQKMVTYNLLHPAKVLHNFERNKVCIVPLKLILHSSAAFDVLVTVNTLGSSSSSPMPSYPPNIYHPKSLKRFRWIGPSGSIHTVKPLSSKCVKLSIAIMGPGTYGVGSRIEIYCQKSDHSDKPTLQTCRMQSAIIVINCDN